MLPDFAAVLSWGKPPESARRQEWVSLLAARGYAAEIDHPHLMVASSSPICCEEVGGSSISVLGSMFSKNLTGPSVRPDPASLIATLRYLVASHWGSYVALVMAPGGIAAMLRDPSGGPATYYAVIENHLVLSTRLALVEAICEVQMPVDDDILAAELIFPNLRGRRTCVAGLRELLPGEALLVTPDGPRLETIWSPGVYLSSAGQISVDEDPAPTLRAAVNLVVETVCGSYDRILLTLSGGLDSSILAVAGRERAESLRFLNLVSGSGTGDEQEFARLVADHLGSPLEVRTIGVEDVNLSISMAKSRPRPSARAFTQSVVKQTNDFANRERVQAILSGHGGDNVFCYVHSAAPASENGWRNFPKSVSDVAAVTECSIPHIAVRALQHRALRWRARRWRQDRSLLARRALLLDQRIVDHPWLTESIGGPGKRAHITALMNGLSFIDFLDSEGGPPFIYPLLSQPVIEACLRVPAWMWYDGGINRAPARRAYAAMLPDRVLSRAAKGAFSNYTRHLYRKNFSLIRDMLLDGYLCRVGIVDKSALEAVLRPETPAHDTTYNRLLRFVDLEAWVTSRS